MMQNVEALNCFPGTRVLPSLGDGRAMGAAVKTDEASLTGLLLLLLCGLGPNGLRLVPIHSLGLWTFITNQPQTSAKKNDPISFTKK